MRGRSGAESLARSKYTKITRAKQPYSEYESALLSPAEEKGYRCPPPLAFSEFSIEGCGIAAARVRHLLSANERLPGGASPIFLFTDLASLLSGDLLTYPWVNGVGEPARLID